MTAPIRPSSSTNMTPGWPLSCGRLAADAAQPLACVSVPDHQLRDALAPVDRLRPGGRLAAAVAVHDDVGGEQLDQRRPCRPAAAAAKNRRASSSRCSREASNRGRPSSMWRRART